MYVLRPILGNFKNRKIKKSAVLFYFPCFWAVILTRFWQRQFSKKSEYQIWGKFQIPKLAQKILMSNVWNLMPKFLELLKMSNVKIITNFGLQNLGKTSQNKNGRSLAPMYGKNRDSLVLILTEKRERYVRWWPQNLGEPYEMPSRSHR